MIMSPKLKKIIKKNFPARYLELVSSNAVTITKIPTENSVISDLFILRIEDEWETNFECLQLDILINPKSNIKPREILFSFFSKSGDLIAEKKVIKSEKIKTTISLNRIAETLGINKDCLFAVFHPFMDYGLSKHKSFLAERGYIGYAHPVKGSIKGFVHGNLDAIAKTHLKKNFKMLSNFSFFNKHYYLQKTLESDLKYELYLVNSTASSQKFKIIEKNGKEIKKTIINISSRGFFKYIKTIDKKGLKTNIIIESKLYLARPVVFKLMDSSFDVFHG
tara:strand:- start:2170 stop:3003 length:834 start_codon:yes stop_codon:yes gene_type:complete